MVTLDNLVVTTALPVIRTDLRRRPRRARVDGQRVHAHLRRAAADRRRARRPLRPPAHVRDRPRHLHRSPRPRPRSRRRSTALDVARAVQGVGGAIVMPLTLTILSAGGAGRAARARARRLGRDQRPRRRVRPARRRRRRLRHLVALDLLAERADRARARCRSRCCGSTRAAARSAGSTCPASGSSSVGPARDRLGPRPRQRARLERRPRSSARSSPASLLVAAFVAWELRTRAPMLPMRFFRNRTFALANVASLLHVLRDVRLDLPARAVLPDGAGLLAARSPGLRILPWTAMPMIVAPIAGALSDRIGGHRLMGAGPRAAGDRPRVDRGGLDADDAVRRPRRAVRALRASAWRSSSPRSRTSCSRRCGREEEGQASGANNAIRELGGVFGVAVLASIFAHYGGYTHAATRSCDGMTPPSTSAPRSSRSARSPRSRSSGRAGRSEVAGSSRRSRRPPRGVEPQPGRGRRDGGRDHGEHEERRGQAASPARRRRRAAGR